MTTEEINQRIAEQDEHFKRNDEWLRRYAEQSDRIAEAIKRRQALVEENEKLNASQNYDGPDHDFELNKKVTDEEIRQGVTSQVYHGRVVSIRLKANNSITIFQSSHHLVRAATEQAPYQPLERNLSFETFLLLLDTMKFAEEKFGLDRAAIINKLTNGNSDTLRINETITVI